MPRRTRPGGGRAARQAARTADAVASVPYLTRSLDPVEVLSTEGLEQIEHHADLLLAEVGIEIHDDPEALQIFADGGADVDGTRVRFPDGMARELVTATAPSSFTQHARNPDRSVVIGDPHMVLAPAYGPPFVSDLDHGRRYATLEDFHNFVKLAWLSPALHHSGGTVCEPVDLPVNKRHLDMVAAHVRLSDKPFMGSVTAPERAQDTVELARIVFGADRLETDTVLLSLCNANSPMSWDRAMLGSAKVYAENNQACIITPFMVAGAMSPVTVAATATQTLAEALAGMAFTQLVRPGAPVVFGSFAPSMSMQTGAPTFGTPEPQLVLFLVAALARRLGVPFRSGGNFTSSKTLDYQAAYESAISFLATMQAGVNFVLHSAGWLEGGLVMGYEKFVLDADQAGMVPRYAAGVATDDNAMALDAMRSHPPGEHWLGHPHTLANFESAFWVSAMANHASFEQWEADGALGAEQRANARWKELLAGYEAPPLDDAIDAEMTEWISRRKAEFPDSDV
ncbi:trimethylamine methyltransferase family protein [Salsipaludibacter albus]|uniref:trimethylamine methyltransferase family protein n=1 Tax=Salsipaludibacter albus TaxID=2849650 RepID=UPI001EE48DA2|nr:trimethylamine methyltransferase family protein [Salsipaludibacter albus]MBY5163395.1 trimethylamine methyltransferase family protein [Salsipaludibacter albus]